MKRDFKLVYRYIKYYKSRSIAIVISMIMATALIVGIGTLAKSANEESINRLKKDTGIYPVTFKDVNKSQFDIIKASKDIKSVGLENYYGSTGGDKNLLIKFYRADKNFIYSSTHLLKGRFPKKYGEVVIEKWILNSLGLDQNINQELTFKINETGKVEKFKIVGIIDDINSNKSVGKCEIYLPININSINKFDANIEFEENCNINSAINNISKEIMIDKDKNVYKNKKLIKSLNPKNRSSSISPNLTIYITIFAGLVIYSIYSISVYQRTKEYGTLRAVGKTNLGVFKLLLVEMFTFGVFSIVVGSAVGLGVASAINKFSGNITYTQFDGYEGNTTSFIVSKESIFMAILCVVVVIFIISLLSFIKICRISPVEAIRRDFLQNKKVKFWRGISRISNKFYVTKNVSIKNMIRDKKAFVIIILSMSLGGLLLIKSDYGYSSSETYRNILSKGTFTNDDFCVNINSSNGNSTGIDDASVSKIKKIGGLKEIKLAKVIHTRLEIKKSKLLNKKYYDYLGKGGYMGSVLNGMFVKDDLKPDDYIVKQKLKGYNDNLLKKLNNYKYSGKIDIDKMKESNLAVVYIPHIKKTPSSDFDESDHKEGKPIANIKVGDTVKVRVPAEKIIDQFDYWKGKDKYKYKEVNFKVGALVDYPGADENQYTAADGIDVILSDSQLRNITGIKNYDIVYANMKNGYNHDKISKKMGKILKKTPGITIQDTVQDKIDQEKLNRKEKAFDFGIILIIFVICIVNIINNISYNLTVRTNEFGMLRAIGLDDDGFKNMLIFEGFLYGFISSIIVLIGGIILQIEEYNRLDYDYLKIDFSINYKLYITIIILNILIGILATYIPLRKSKNIEIIESINTIE